MGNHMQECCVGFPFGYRSVAAVGIELQRMKFDSPLFFATGLLLLVASWPGAHSQEQKNLGERITDYWHSRSCTASICKNPVLVVHSHWIEIIRVDASYRVDQMQVDKLRDYLQAMPLSVWPEGPRVWVQRSDFEIVKPGDTMESLEAAKDQEMKAVAQVCEVVGLTRTLKGGEPWPIPPQPQKPR